MRKDTRRWIDADKAHCWHPFTPQQAWTESEALVLVRGEGSWLWDSEGRRYLDGNSSIWTNIHGHNHPHLNAAITRQLGEIAHSSYLGFANPRASELAERLCALFPPATLERVFFSDDGSTAVECAMKMAIQFRQQSGEPERDGFIAFDQAYHGDTLGAASLGGVARFQERFRKHGLPVRFVADLDALRALPADIVATTAALVIEPLIQGVNEMRPWPAGMLRALRTWCDTHGVHLILDEVMTGFGRTGKMFACQHEDVIPDFLCLAKGLTGGYLPLAATMTTGRIYDAFLGEPDRAFYYGHSYTANPLGCAAALASLDVFEQEQTLDRLQPKIARMTALLGELKSASPRVRDIRQCGFIAGIEVDHDGAAVCLAARDHGILTRPIRDTLVLMPPLSTTEEELATAVEAIARALEARP
ncbi:MAG: adenosylmethionine--8-amino-7-oxononanoate transaminase [Verrucomicrobia bacterium]|nr:MAG: adenosylmethionine--8-amino-7-oxononanoate transaminase [Verrucomicrobiota bacterium]TAE88761.1 MAG: adenosylmethionine--8-amino-7-oxononanoate transaminase [Verrucomicrobiota bacterium]TAF26562.1 MAG: adenosylmethionine--8-amino-7-oxononanoate transaminase [Verrucomicrobiota bacterium]